jgi:hypothetical protein
MAALKTLFAAGKSIFGALTWKLVADALSAVIGRIGWTVVLERLLTRTLVALLRWIKELSTNDVVDDTVDDIVKQLEGKRLAKASE